MDTLFLIFIFLSVFVGIEQKATNKEQDFFPSCVINGYKKFFSDVQVVIEILKSKKLAKKESQNKSEKTEEQD